MTQVAILYIALGRYTVFWDDFYKSCEKYLTPCDKHYFIWTDSPTPAMRGKNITIIPTQKRGWPYDSLMRFEMFLDVADKLQQFDYVYFFNANFQFYNPVDLAEITPREWHNGLVAGLYPGMSGDIDQVPDHYPYERRPKSAACVPYGHGRHYVCGAFNGGTADAFLKMCRVLAKNVQTDLKRNIVACVDDESHLNAYMVKHPNFLLCGRAYGFPEGELKHIPLRQRIMVKIISRAKDSPKYGGTQWLRGNTDKKMSTSVFAAGIRKLLRVVACAVPSAKWRRKIRGLY